MKMLLAGAAIALTTMVSQAHAADCGDQVSRFMPAELSPYQECWLDTHKADEEHGVLGSILWVKVNERYYSTQLNSLTRAIDFEAAVAEWFNANVISAELSREIYTKTQTDLDDQLEVAIESKDIEAITEIVEIQKSLTPEQIKEAIEENLSNTKLNYTVPEQNGITVKRYSGAYNDYNYHGGDWIGEVEVKLNKVQSSKLGAFNVVNYVKIGNHYIRYEHKYLGMSSNIPLYGTIKVMGKLDKFTEMLEAIYDAGYDDGYNDGYEDGYEDGYAQGFKDGVASVSQ